MVTVISLPPFSHPHRMDHIHEDFLGTWEYEREEGLDAYLTGRGFTWTQRKLQIYSPLSITFANFGEGECCVEQKNPFGRITHIFTPEKACQEEGIDGIEYLTLIQMNGSTLIVTRIQSGLGRWQAFPEEITHRIENGILVQNLRYKKIECKRYFRKKLV
ncbi:hypothetical protein PFISCL1PPCAC_7059 [Pristionchus fissidentatus]|uniref:Lipocalin/cytosolic fatty-acid binding domain-containing protein n=1 Tax=Pristionchus fissidentatus TaxID=1538716 RepID=A0AAV5VC42_9BILA|nr:hypothetical protein PFISCL1PPCAC_7059 [Pristionchus fissidentatus]